MNETSRTSKAEEPQPRTVRADGYPRQRGNSNTLTSGQRIALVGCVKLKRSGTHAAKDLYIEPLFTKRRAYAEATGDRWYILSGLHGLVAPDARLSTYDCTLNTMSAAEQRAWGERVLGQLRATLGDLGGLHFQIHAGARYVDAICDGLRDAGATFDVPTAGLGHEQQVAWYSRQLSDG